MTDQEILEALASTDIPKFEVAEDDDIMKHWRKDANGEHLDVVGMTSMSSSMSSPEAECCSVTICGGFCT